MITILYDRSYIDKATNTPRQAFKTNVVPLFAPSVEDLWKQVNQYIEQIPEHERYNIHYTLGYNREAGSRDWISQDIIPFDIDKNPDLKRVNEYTQIVAKVCNVDENKIGIAVSGNGIHYIIKTDKWTSRTYFSENRALYRAMCKVIDQEMEENTLPGETDKGVFAVNHTLRLPETINRKHDGDTKSYIINDNIEYIGFDLLKSEMNRRLSTTTNRSSTLRRSPDDRDRINDKIGSKKYDSETIIEKCSFLKTCRDFPNAISEEEWYAMLGTLVYVSEELCHEMSENYTGYEKMKTEVKMHQARTGATGPRTCESISSFHKPCSICEYNGKIKTPLEIKRENFFPTKDDGFYFIELSAKGIPKRIPDVEGLVRYFHMHNKHVTDSHSKEVWTWNGSYFAPIYESELESWINSTMDPMPHTSIVKEVRAKIELVKCVRQEFFNPTGYFNFKNKVWDMKNNKYIEPTPGLGFTGQLPFEADETGNCDCPTFHYFLESTMQGNKDAIRVLCEYAAYCISGLDPRTFEQMLFLVGEGSNGKSVFLDIIKWLVGEENFSALSLDQMKDPQNLQTIVNKTVNLCDEIDARTDLKPAMLKNIISGGEIMVKKLYTQPYKHRVRTKFIFSANRLPHIPDDSYGMKRRLIIVPFSVQFGKNGKTDDKGLRDKLKLEIPQIFNYLVKYVAIIAAKKKFTYSQVVDDALTDFIDENDSIGYYLKNNVDIVVNPDVTNYPTMHNKNPPKTEGIILDDLYRDYKEYCKEGGIRATSILQFNKRIAYRFDKRLKKIKVLGRPRELLLGIRLWNDVTLKEDY